MEPRDAGVCDLANDNGHDSMRCTTTGRWQRAARSGLMFAIATVRGRAATPNARGRHERVRLHQCTRSWDEVNTGRTSCRTRRSWSEGHLEANVLGVLISVFVSRRVARIFERLHQHHASRASSSPTAEEVSDSEHSYPSHASGHARRGTAMSHICKHDRGLVRHRNSIGRDRRITTGRMAGYRAQRWRRRRRSKIRRRRRDSRRVSRLSRSSHGRPYRARSRAARHARRRVCDGKSV